MAEYGIVASLVITAIALWTKSNKVLPIAAALLASFHGMAHGVELAHAGHIVALVTGMVAGMALIYSGGLVLGVVLTRYVPYGKNCWRLCSSCCSDWLKLTKTLKKKVALSYLFIRLLSGKARVNCTSFSGFNLLPCGWKMKLR